jgi:putative phage-type endonuclease
MKKYNMEQKSDEWFHIRNGKITGTTLKAIMGTPKARQEAIYEILAEKLTTGVESESGFENAMDRGNRLEGDAITIFEFETKKQVERIGFCENDDNTQIANSPDGLIGETEAVEAKCMGGKNHIKMWLTNKVPDEYEWQVVQYFIVNKKLEKLYFIGYNPDIPIHPLHIIEVNRETILEDIENAQKSQEQFLKEVEELLGNIIKI